MHAVDEPLHLPPQQRDLVRQQAEEDEEAEAEAAAELDHAAQVVMSHVIRVVSGIMRIDDHSTIERAVERYAATFNAFVSGASERKLVVYNQPKVVQAPNGEMLAEGKPHVVILSERMKQSRTLFDDDSSPLSNALSRRELALIAASTVFSYYPDSSSIKLAHARNSSLPTVLVIGSTGQTGKLVVSSLSRTNNANVVAGCRSLEKAKKLQLDQNGVELLGGGKCTRSRSTKMF